MQSYTAYGSILAVNEKYTETITPLHESELLFSLMTGPPRAVDIVSGVVLWPIGRAEWSWPSQYEPYGASGLPRYCHEVLNLNEQDLRQVLRFHRKYGPYWDADFVACAPRGEPQFHGYALARFQDEVRRLRAVIAIRSALRRPTRTPLVSLLGQLQRVAQTYHSLAEPLGESMPKRRWSRKLKIPRGPLLRFTDGDEVVIRPLSKHSMGYRDSGPAVDVHVGVETLSPEGWASVLAAWGTEGEPAQAESSIEKLPDRELLRYAASLLEEYLCVPFIRPRPRILRGSTKRDLIVAFELRRAADFVHLAIAADMARGVLPERCHNEACRNYFIPSRPRQVHCSKECQRAQAVRRHRRNAKLRERR